jgi:tetratricopeptide (TPR) repeat protein
MRLPSVAATVFALSFAPVTSHAQGAPGVDLARKHSDLARKLYQTSQHGEALVEFKKAYELAPLPDLLFNIARCHEVLAQLEEAVRHYQLYLDQRRDAPDRALVELRIANLRQRLAEQRRPAARWKRPAGWILAGVGAASLVAGIVCGAVAKQKGDDFASGLAGGRPYGELMEIDSAGKRYQTAQIATLVAGGVLAATGGALLLWDGLRRPESRRAAITPYATGAGVGIAARARF